MGLLHGACQGLILLELDVIPPLDNGQRSKDFQPLASSCDRYYRVKYEDLAASPVVVLRDIYRFIGIPFTKRSRSIILQHSRATEEQERGWDKAYRSHYYSTFRTKEYNRQAWREWLPKEHIESVQQQCQVLMKRLDYDFLAL